MKSVKFILPNLRTGVAHWVLTSVLVLAGIIPGDSGAADTQGSIVGWGSTEFGIFTNIPAGKDFVAISLGSYFALALRSDGTLAAWGVNDSGQIIVPSGNDFRAVAAGFHHGIALRTDGSLVGWGRNGSFQADVPRGNDFKAISAGGAHNLAVRTDGSLIAWGSRTDVPSGNDFVAVSAGNDHSVALRSNGTLAAWGSNSYGEGTAPSGSNFVAVSAGNGHCLALRSDGTLIGWGKNNYGQAAAPSGNGFVAVSAGQFHGLALKADGTLQGWGRNFENLATPPGGYGFIGVAGGLNYNLVLLARPILEVDRSHSFKTTLVGRTGRPQKVAIRNPGDGTLTRLRTNVASSGRRDFKVGDVVAKEVSPGTSTYFSAQFKPRSAGLKKAYVSIISRNAGIKFVVLRGRGR